MDWFVVRHPETGGAGVVAESALPTHRGLGWLRVSDAVSEMDKDQIDLSAYANAPDLDAVPAATEPDDQAEDDVPAETPREN